MDASKHVLSRLLPAALMMIAVACLAAPPDPSPAKPAPPPLSKATIAYWSFDEPSGALCRDASGHGYDAKTDQPGAVGLARTKGLFGNAMSFSGTHRLFAADKLELAPLSKISLSAWVMPSNLSGYREIFRKEDGDDRILFAFQADGSILALGLNVGGYVECDAKIDASRVLDGMWHHCAATFDGQFMRVYFDGKEIGSLERRGAITAGDSAPACIASGGGSECFQGEMDELAVYADTLTPEDVALVYRNGEALAQAAFREHRKDLQAIYVRGASFAETVSSVRREIANRNLHGDRRLINELVAMLRTDFPDECEQFRDQVGVLAATLTPAGSQPYDQFYARTNTAIVNYLTSTNHDVEARLIELAAEYKPRTEAQWASQTPEQRRKWEEVSRLEKRFAQLKAQGDAAKYSPKWVELMMAASERFDVRPIEREPVAPYRTPHTPETRTLSAAEARDALRRDWLHQADGQPTPKRIQSEIEWTRGLAQRLAAEHGLDFTAELRELKTLEAKVTTGASGSLSGASGSLSAAATPSQARADKPPMVPDAELYFQVRRLKRGIMFKNPAIDFDKLVLVDMPDPDGSEPRHETRHRLGYMAVPGGRLLVLDGLSPDGKVRQLMPQAPLHGSFWRPDVSFDGRRVLFCYKPDNEKSFHLYEINVDGSGLTQLTDGPYDDLDPIYLPDDRHIIFSTTRGNSYVRCMPPTNAFVLARCDRDGRNVYLISANNEPDYLPSVMNDGRIIYTRWEYTDKPLWRAQKLWTINPDGTQVNTYWGNQSVWPDLLKDARSIPGSRRVMFTGSAHHDWFAGSVGIVDPDHGYNFPDGLKKITADVAWPESGNGPIDPIESASYHPSGKYHAYYSPYPLSEKDFLVSAEREGKFVLYLMDVDGNRELVYEGANHIFHAMPLKPREKPPVIVDRVAWPDREHRLTPADGVIFSGNVYQGAPAELRGKAKYLRVLHIDPKTYTYWNNRPALSTGPVVSMVQSEGVKRVLGTVPIEADGSVAFHAPAGKALHFQLLDENHRALQTMRSFVGVMPGERRGCLGCHESHSRTPQAQGASLALRKEPNPITPPAWGVDTVSYPRYVQPVLDQYCAKCHEGNGEAVKTCDLTPRPGLLGFVEPYYLMTGQPTWASPYQKPANPPPGFGIAGMLMVEGYSTLDPAAYKTPAPMTALSYKSRLVELAASGKHYGVNVDPVSLEKLTLWVDAMCPYRGEEEIREIPDPEFQGVDWLAIRPRIRTAPVIVRPGPVD
jgi:hypothetical protein